ncbi:hypothetical protein G7Z17_g4099 [Cylindrodendrum hubeiense]|uniref:Amino acid permease/ SLC12A domain-containing protein n=1 Tax=Cylindrodendrum hubeiense TaxID=595255 RepID=A0A9P5HFJ5_9HYPO|nr:hypothetical protein G7Z17_g4099 [Cylindrodendrum hubeiense]
MPSFSSDTEKPKVSTSIQHIVTADSSVVEREQDSNGPRQTTHRGLKSRHAQMIAIGGTIGTALFVSIGRGLHMGGPVFTWVAYLLFSGIVFGIITATTEMSSYLPVPGSSIAYYANRFYSPSLGFALGWMYWYTFMLAVPLEITAAAIVVEYWDTPVPLAAWITIFLVVVVALNCFPVKYYGEVEFWFASIKVFGIIGLLIMAVILIFGGGPNHDMLGFRYWREDPVHEWIVAGDGGRLSGFVATVAWSVGPFAFAPELLVICGGEMANPRQNLPTAGRRYFYRLILFYILGSLAISMICDSNSPRLLGGGSGAAASPWAIAAKEAGIKGLDSVINAVILTSAWSSGNAYLYLATRSLYSLAVSGNAPKIFAQCTRSGVPHYAMVLNIAFCFLAYMNIKSSTSDVFYWFLTLGNTSAFQSWIAICVLYLQFRKAVAAQGIDELPYRSRFQPYLVWVSGSILSVLLLVSGFGNFIPGNFNISNFLVAYIGIPIFIALYLGHRFTLGRSDPWVMRPGDVDLISGLAEIIAAETMPTKGHERWYMLWKRVFA